MMARLLTCVIALLASTSWVHADSLSSRPIQSGGGGGSSLLASSSVAVSGANDTNENTLATITINNADIGANGCIKWSAILTNNNSATNKTWNIKLGGTGGTAYFTRNNLNTTGVTVSGFICNRNSASSQIGGLLSGMSHTGSSLTAASVTSTVNISTSTTLVITATKATGTDTMTMESYLVEKFPQS